VNVGKDAVFALFGRLAEQTGGSFRVDGQDLLANDEHGRRTTSHCDSEPRRSQPECYDVNVFHLRDGRVSECWLASTDQRAEDEFWA
jgi:hypothetical protein